MKRESAPDFLASLRSFSQSCPFPLEVILVDDGSTDGTASLLEDAPYQVIRHDTNRGYGAAIKTGVTHARYEATAIADADGTYNLDDLLAMVPHLDQCDMAVGARTGQDTQIPLMRRPAKWLIGVFAAWLTRRSIPDLNSGLRAFRRSEVEKILRLLPDGFSLTTTLTIAFHTGGRRVYYQPIRYGKRAGRSKFRPLADTWNMILLILRTVVLIRPLNFFVPFSLFLFLLALGVGIVSKFVFDHFMDATFIVLMMTSIQMFALGLIADLIVRTNLWTH